MGIGVVIDDLQMYRTSKQVCFEQLGQEESKCGTSRNGIIGYPRGIKDPRGQRKLGFGGINGWVRDKEKR